MSQFNKRLITDTLVYIGLPKLSFIASFLILPWISPFLTLDDYGIYGLLISYISVFQVIIGLGQVILLQNSYFTLASKYKLVWRRSFGLMILFSLLSTLFFSILLKFTLADRLNENLGIVIILVGIYLVLSPLESILINFYSLKEQSLPYAIGMGIIGLVSTIITLITIRYFKFGYLGWIYSLFATSLLTHIYFFKRIYIVEKIFPDFRFNKRFIKKSLNIGLPLSPHQLSMYILGVSDRLLLEFYKIPMIQIGFYSQGYSIGSQGSILINGIFQAFTKKIQDSFRGVEKHHIAFIRKSIIVIPIIISLTLFLASLWCSEVFLILFKNPELQKSYPISIVVLASYMYWGLYSFFTYPLSIGNKSFSISKITILAATINIIGNIILIPFYGYWASLGVTYFSYIVFGFAGLLNNENRRFLNKYLNITKFCFAMLILNVVLLLIAYLFKDASIIIKTVLTLSTLAVAFFIVKHAKSL
jgi:O-antigen/teichoic acid export membrane protein